MNYIPVAIVEDAVGNIWGGGDPDVVPIGVLGGDGGVAGRVEVLEDGGNPRDPHLAHQDGVHEVQRRQSGVQFNFTKSA